MEARQFLSVDDQGEERRLCLDEEVIQSYLLQSDEVADKPVVVLSVAGEFRTGKSFLLNSMTRYLEASDKSRWLDNKSESFSWKSGCTGHTNGMSMSRPIPVTLQSGEEAVLLLMDTQGIFDDNSTMTDSTRIFALSTLLSSVQIFNVMNDLKSDDLDNLQLFVEYGRLAMGNSEGKPFQDLLFLVRDWQHAQDHAFGGQGGNDLVERRLKSNKESIAQRRQNLKTYFTDVSGFLLPNPGKIVAGSPTFDGDAKDMEPKFITALEELMSVLLSPERLTVKKNGDRPVTCRQLATLIKTYTDLFQSGELSDIMTILQAVAKGSNMEVVNNGLHTYMSHMKSLLDEGAPMLHEELLREKEEHARTAALKSLQLQKTMRDPTKSEAHYHDLLVEKMEEVYSQTLQKLFQQKCIRDLSKARESNEKLVDKCLNTYDESTEQTNGGQSNNEQEIREVHAKARKKALLDFSSEVVSLGSYSGEQSKQRLEDALDRRLTMALKRNEENNNMAAVNEGLESYMRRMKDLLSEDAPMLDEGLLSDEHTKAKDEALNGLKTNLTISHCAKSEDYFSRILANMIENSFKTLQTLFEAKCKQDEHEADKKNDELAQKCLNQFVKTMDSLGQDKLKDEKLVNEAAKEAHRNALQLFDKDVITFGSYSTGDRRTKVEDALNESLSTWRDGYIKKRHESLLSRPLNCTKGVFVSVWSTCSSGIQAVLSSGGALVSADGDHAEKGEEDKKGETVK